MGVVTYKAAPTARHFHASNDFVRELIGPFGSGKSVACVMEIFMRCLQQEPGPDGVRRSRWAVVRNTYRELQDTTLNTWKDWIPTRLGRWKESKMTHYLRFNDVEAEIMFRALDRPQDVKKLLSLELTGAWLNESKEVPKAIFDVIQGRIGRYPPKKLGGPTWAGLICDTNPPDQDHYAYKLFEETKPPGHRVFHQPSGLSDLAENVENLPDKYYERMAQGKDPEWVKVYVDGQYGFVIDGKPVYPEYSDAIHCKEVRFIPGRSVYVGIDFGLTPAAVFGQRSAFGQVRILDELVTEDMGIQRFAGLFKQKVRDVFPAGTKFRVFGDPAGVKRAETDERTVFQVLQAEKIYAEPAETNEFRMRREAFATSMTRMIDGHPGFLVDPKCKMLRKAVLGGYCYKRRRLSGAAQYVDTPDKGIYSHVADAGQYMTLGMGESLALLRKDENKNLPRQAMMAYDPLAPISSTYLRPHV